MSVRILSPYEESCAQWLKGNLHAHSTNSDGRRSPQELVDAYAALGYDFLMISDHDFFTDPDTLEPRGMTLLPGYELTANGPHIVHVGVRECLDPVSDRQAVLDAMRRNGGFGIMAHPNWEEHFNHCPQERLEEWEGYAGIEICNGVCLILPGSGYALDRWDLLLGKGRRVWGYAHDDCHWPTREGMAWNMAQCADRRPQAIIEALRTGRCYASTGVTLDSVAVSGDVISVRAAQADQIAVYTDFQERLGVFDTQELEFRVPVGRPLKYVRFECLGKAAAAAWTQPFFLEWEE